VVVGARGRVEAELARGPEEEAREWMRERLVGSGLSECVVGDEWGEMGCYMCLASSGFGLWGYAGGLVSLGLNMSSSLLHFCIDVVHYVLYTRAMLVGHVVYNTSLKLLQ